MNMYQILIVTAAALIATRCEPQEDDADASNSDSMGVVFDAGEVEAQCSPDCNVNPSPTCGRYTSNAVNAVSCGSLDAPLTAVVGVDSQCAVMVQAPEVEPLSAAEFVGWTAHVDGKEVAANDFPITTTNPEGVRFSFTCHELPSGQHGVQVSIEWSAPDAGTQVTLVAIPLSNISAGE